MGEQWSGWTAFPDPRKGGILTAPFGAGCYEVRRRDTGQLVLFGMGGHLASRITSLLPEPLGTGTRNNAAKRAYVLENIDSLEYRTVAFANVADAKRCEQSLKANKTSYIFGT